MDEAAKYDDIFAEMAGRLGGLPPMMDAFFGFLARSISTTGFISDACRSDANVSSISGGLISMFLPTQALLPQWGFLPE